jgi:hypothetical protein
LSYIEVIAPNYIPSALFPVSYSSHASEKRHDEKSNLIGRYLIRVVVGMTVSINGI